MNRSPAVMRSHDTPRLPRLGRWLVAATCLLILLGCGDSQRHSLSGTVTLDDQPLSEGMIQFRPLSGTPGPTAGGEIRDGRFAITAERGTFAGKFRVEITARRKTGRKTHDELAGTTLDEYEQYLPSRYNSESDLIVEVTEAGPNEFPPFELTSQ